MYFSVLRVIAAFVACVHDCGFSIIFGRDLTFFRSLLQEKAAFHKLTVLGCMFNYVLMDFCCQKCSSLGVCFSVYRCSTSGSVTVDAVKIEACYIFRNLFRLDMM